MIPYWFKQIPKRNLPELNFDRKFDRKRLGTSVKNGDVPICETKTAQLLHIKQPVSRTLKNSPTEFEKMRKQT